MSRIKKNSTPNRGRPVDNRYRLSAWRKKTKRARQEEMPCEELGCNNVGEIYDHRIRLKIGGAILDDRNHRRQCKKDHFSKTKLEMKGMTLEFVVSKHGLLPKENAEWIPIPRWLSECVGQKGSHWIQTGGLYRKGWKDAKFVRVS